MVIKAIFTINNLMLTEQLFELYIVLIIIIIMVNILL
jgi:hypothetical protein